MYILHTIKIVHVLLTSTQAVKYLLKRSLHPETIQNVLNAMSTSLNDTLFPPSNRVLISNTFCVAMLQLSPSGPKSDAPSISHSERGGAVTPYDNRQACQEHATLVCLLMLQYSASKSWLSNLRTKPWWFNPA